MWQASITSNLEYPPPQKDIKVYFLQAKKAIKE